MYLGQTAVISGLSVVPRVVPPTSKFDDLQCQTILKALMGAKDNLVNCRTGKS